MRLSIIIPAYNVEKYIAQCLESCLEQDIPHDDYEIIVVNDGSIDRTQEVLDRYAAEYPNIRLFEKKNGGQSTARNLALDNAKGEYIWFVDSDDWIKPNCLKGLLLKAEKDCLDLLLFEIVDAQEGDGKEQTNFFGCFEDRVYSLEEYANYRFIPHEPVCYLAKRIMFEQDTKLRFLEGYFHEDAEMNSKLFPRARRIARYFGEKNDEIGNSLYYYRTVHAGSTMNNVTLTHIKKRIESNIVVLQSIHNSFNSIDEELFPETKSTLEHFHNELFRVSLLPLFRFLPRKERASHYRTLAHKYSFQLIVQSRLSERVKSVNGILSFLTHSYKATSIFVSFVNQLKRLKRVLP